MHLEAAIVVPQTNEQVWRFFEDPANLAKWDRSVAQVVSTSPEPFGVGSTFDTIAPARKSSGKEGLRMSYRTAEYAPSHQVRIQLTYSPIFSSADWIMTTETAAEGVRITCGVDFTLRLRYSFLLPVLLLTYRGAFRRDLTYLKHAIARNAGAA